MSRVTYSVVSDAVFYDREAEIALLEQLLRTCGAAEIEVARACRQAIQDLESPTETIGRFKAIRGDHPDDRGDSEFSVPVEEFDPRQRLDSIWKDLNRDTRQLLGAAKRTTDLFEGRRVGFAAAAVAVLVGSAMEHELWSRTAELRSRFKKGDPMPWSEGDNARSAKPRLFDGRWTCCDLIRLAERHLVERDKAALALFNAHRVRQLRNEIHPTEAQSHDAARPMTPVQLNRLLFHAGLVKTARWPTFWHVLSWNLAPASSDEQRQSA